MVVLYTILDMCALVSSLCATGLPTPDPITGDVVEALWKAGFFRLRGVLVGTVAFQTYAGLLGTKLAGSSLMTGDVDVAQFHSVSLLVDDSTPAMGRGAGAGRSQLQAGAAFEQPDPHGGLC